MKEKLLLDEEKQVCNLDYHLNHIISITHNTDNERECYLAGLRQQSGLLSLKHNLE